MPENGKFKIKDNIKRRLTSCRTALLVSLSQELFDFLSLDGVGVISHVHAIQTFVDLFGLYIETSYISDNQINRKREKLLCHRFFTLSVPAIYKATASPSLLIRTALTAVLAVTDMSVSAGLFRTAASRIRRV